MIAHAKSECPEWPPQVKKRIEQICNKPKKVLRKTKLAYRPSGIVSKDSILKIVLNSLKTIFVTYLAGLIVVPLFMVLFDGNHSIITRLLLGFVTLLIILNLLRFYEAFQKDALREGQCRNTLAGILAFVFPALICYIPAYLLLWRTAINNNYYFWFLSYIAMFFLGQTIIVSNATFAEVERKIYCEKCNIYMWSQELCCLSLNNAEEALLLLVDWKLDEFNAMPKVDSWFDERIEFVIWKCNDLHDCVFYINAIAYGLTKHKDQYGRIKEKKWDRLIFSSPIKPIFARDLQDKLKS